MWLLIKCMVVLTLIVTMFFLKSIPNLHQLTYGWIALLGLILIMIVTYENDLDHCIHQVEWSTLLFFASLFILMENLAALGLIKEITEVVESILVSVQKDKQMTVSIFLVVFVSFDIFLNNKKKSLGNIRFGMYI